MYWKAAMQVAHRSPRSYPCLQMTGANRRCALDSLNDGFCSAPASLGSWDKRSQTIAVESESMIPRTAASRGRGAEPSCNDTGNVETRNWEANSTHQGGEPKMHFWGQSFFLQPGCHLLSPSFENNETGLNKIDNRSFGISLLGMSKTAGS